MDENKKKLAAWMSEVQPAGNDLLELVQKNKQIPCFLNDLMPKDKELLRLKEAISQGNFQVSIWNNPQCHLYLIYLIQKKVIPFWQGITAYVYLIAKMQYTKQQRLRPEDEDVKLNYRVNVIPLVEAGKLSELGGQYLFGVIHALEKLKIYFNLSELMAYVLALPSIEQWLIKTEFNHHLMPQEIRNDSNRLVWILLENLPLVQKISGGSYDDLTTQYLVPSSSLINYFFQGMGEQPMQMRPVLGNPGLKTLYQWHQEDFHPVSLYSPEILSNPKDADGYRCGPFGLWLHDLGHTFWANLLSKSQREYIFRTYIPALRHLGKIAKAFNDDSSIEMLKEIEIRAYDFDLTAISDYANQETRFDTYLAHTIGKNPVYKSCLYLGAYEFETIGRAEGDTLYFLVHYAMYSAETPEIYKEIYQILIRFISTGKSYRDQRIVNALRTLAKNAATDPENLFAHGRPLWKSDRRDWFTLINSNPVSEELWWEITRDVDRAQELLYLIEQGLMFFHPYLPMTDPKRRELLNYLDKDNQVTWGTESSQVPLGNGTIESTCQSQFFRFNSPQNLQAVPSEEDVAELRQPKQNSDFSIAKRL